MIRRRDLLQWIAAGFGTGLPPVQAAEAPASEPVPVVPFDPGQVVDRARALAKQPHQAANPALPSPLANLTYEQYVAIKLKPGNEIWADDGIGFAIEPLQRGYLFSAPVLLNLVEGGIVRRLTYQSDQFDFGAIHLTEPLQDLGFSGFRVLRNRSDRGLMDAAIFQGASFFRSLANGQNFGVTARALSIRTGDTERGEEFPSFREMWIERPSPVANVLVIHALVEAETMTGAYRFTLRPGDVTIIDTECTLFARSAAEFFGLGCAGAMFLFGPTRRSSTDDVRQGVFEVSGLQMLNDNGEWLWRPVSNPQTLQISSFVATNPRGFGLLQRERNFSQLQDDDQHWEMRPSLWIEPINDWGEGSVVLAEIPSDSENNDNILCFWRPKPTLQAGAEISFASRQFWCWTPPDHPPQAVVTTTRVGRGSTQRRRRFLVEFTADRFAEAQAAGDLKPACSTSVGSVVWLRTFLSQQRKTYRVLFELDFGGEPLAELRLLLEAGGKPASETWLYRWTA